MNNFFARFLNWQKVREFGELQVLTRASYLMLILIPIIAGLWPGVRMVINQYNQAVTDSRVALEVASDRLKNEAKNIEHIVKNNVDDTIKSSLSNRAHDILHELDSRINQILSDYSYKTIEKTALPNVWVNAFLASLCVFIAHFIYQKWVPDIVRQSSIQQFGINRRNLHAENPSDGFIDRARYYLNESKLSYMSNFDTPPIDPAERKKWELDIVENGAYAEYNHYSRRKLLGAWISGLFYLGAIILILWIATNQTLSVLRAAEWIN